MTTNDESPLCRYHYDPLDRLAHCTPAAQPSSQRFYLKDRLATEIQGALQRSILQHDDQLLAQQQRQNDALDTRLLATDQQRSVLAILDATRPHHLAYTPYGYRVPENGLLSLLGFNGERPDPVTGHYLLGNGYRAFNPVLMRFNSPDSWSPFGRGGLNAYGYCAWDPMNKGDSTGHFPRLFNKLMKLLKPRSLPSRSNHVTDITNRPTHSTTKNITSTLTSDSSTAKINAQNSSSSIGTSPSRREINPMYVPIHEVTTNRTYHPNSKQNIMQWIDSAPTPPPLTNINFAKGQFPETLSKRLERNISAGRTLRPIPENPRRIIRDVNGRIIAEISDSIRS